MSMSFSEFKKLIGADPKSRESRTIEARGSNPEFETAAREAKVFEDKLEAALKQIKDISLQGAYRSNWIPMALAATLVIAVGVSGLVWKQAARWGSIEDYLSDHYSHDGASLVAKAVAPVDKADIDRILARLDTSMNQQLAENIRFIKFCPTPDGRGAHMVIDTAQGLMTVILMPHTDVADGQLIEFQDMRALLVSLGTGSAAIIGDQNQGFEELQAMVRQSLSLDVIGA